ncbi:MULTISPECIES: TauD/TfdA family dioxygenase [Actinomycetes]|uniref:TauD/TfdA family dioxygenase n=1 Tax=Actinomycetes TaxID=1760 RepID=UPI0001B55A0D|nr:MULTISPECIES: TauD/TfdA family dioxygenase [Actinomycetes]EFL04403.1 predicted protein [Streptomyces sp. AA4]
MRFLAEVVEQPGGDTVDVVGEALAEHKVVVLRRAADVDSDAFYWRLASALGHFHFHFRDEDPGGLDKPGRLDIRYDPDLAAGSRYRYGNGRMPLHVDGVYSDVDFDVFFIRCRAAARFGGATFAVDGTTVVEYLSASDPALLRALLNVEVRFSKGERVVTRRVIDYEGGDPVFNWSSTRVAGDNPPEVVRMCARFADFCEQRLVDGGLVEQIRLAPGDAVFVHNRKVLHGRYAFWGERCMLKGVLDLRPRIRGEEPA